MDLILTSKDGKEIRTQDFKKFDVDTADTKDFELTIPTEEYDEFLSVGARLFVPNTEYGGIIGGRAVVTSENELTLKGHTWRGLIAYKIISPPSGQAYKIVSGELNTIIRGLITDAGIDDLFRVPETSTGITLTNYQFNRYIDLYRGIEKMLNEVQNIGQNPPYRMNFEYVQQQNGTSGYVKLEAKPCVDYSDTIELSQDSELNFKIEQVRNGVNHLICLGGGELTARVVRHLYADIEGNISQTQSLFGVDEITDIYDYGSAEDVTTLINDGIKQLQELTNNNSFEMDAASLDINVAIGDTIGGRDYITGMVCKDKITNKIYKVEDGNEAVEYRIGGQATDFPIIE